MLPSLRGRWQTTLTRTFLTTYPLTNDIFYLTNIDQKLTFLDYILIPTSLCQSRGWVPKFATGLIYQIKHSSKVVEVIKLSFGQNDPPMRESFWQNNSLVTHTLFELCSIWYINPVANFGTHPLVCRWTLILSIMIR